MQSLEIATPEWFLPFLEPSRYKAIHGGRGSSKSHTVAEYIIELLVMDQNKKVICAREVQKSLAQSVKALLEDKIKKFGVESYFDVQQNMIKCQHGEGIVIFQGLLTHTADSIKSLEGFDLLWIEEAQSVSQRSLDLLRPTIRKKGSEIIAT